ncbi:MAG: hypothetical protein ACRCZI_01520, partial [Cetobacterium sp.]
MIKDDFGSFPLRRAEDEFLMPCFLMARYTETKLKTLNECRIYLHAITLADITTASGNTLCKESYNGRRTNQFLHQYEWPRNPQTLPNAHWNLWKKALTKCFLRQDTDKNERSLTHPLGKWLVDPAKHWKWFYDHQSETLLKTSGGAWDVYKTTRRTRDHKQAVYLHVETVHTSPEGKTIACVTERSTGGIVLRTKCSHSYSPPTPATTQAPTTLLEAKSQMSTRGNWAIEELKTSDDGAFLATLLASDQVIAVCDGSYDEGISTSSFIITSRTKGITQKSQDILGSNCIPGHPEDQNSYRAELGRIIGIMTTLSLWCKLHHIPSGKIEIGLDG